MLDLVSVVSLIAAVIDSGWLTDCLLTQNDP